MVWIYKLALEDITYLTMGGSFYLSEAPFVITVTRIISAVYLGRLSEY